MSEPVRERAAMVAGMHPVLDNKAYVFCSGGELRPEALAAFHEPEGLSQVLPLDAALEAGFDVSLPMACISLTVHSALDGVGLTATVSGALAEHGIACNMLSAFHHDYVFVPKASAANAFEILKAVQQDWS